VTTALEYRPLWRAIGTDRLAATEVMADTVERWAPEYGVSQLEFYLLACGVSHMNPHRERRDHSW
jgi:hypothetical protein